MMKRLFLILSFLCLCAPAKAADAGPSVPRWSVALSQSTFTFRGRQMGTEFHGTFGKFAPDIAFDPDHPDHGSVKVDFDISTFATGDRDRDKTAATKDWFDPAHFPSARFESHAFKKTGAHDYVADGTLTIKGVSVPLRFPFMLTVVQDGKLVKAHMKGSATVDRSKFGLGAGEWSDTSVIANNVIVDMDLIAFRK